MYKKILLAVALAFSFTLSQTVFADDWGCGEGLHKMVAALNIDDAQKAKIKPILDQLKTSMTDLGTQMGDLAKQLRQQVQSPSMDQAVVYDLVDKKAKLIGDMMKTKVMATSQILAILTPEQKTKLQGMIQQLEEKMEAKWKSCNQD